MRIDFKKYIICILTFVVLFSCMQTVAFAREKDIDIFSSVDKDAVYVGDKIKLNVIAENASSYDVVLPEKPENLGEFEFVESRALNTTGREYMMSIYTTGTHVVPPVPVKCRKMPDGEWKELLSHQFPIEVISTLTGEEKDIVDIKGLAEFGKNIKRLIRFLLILVFVGAVGCMLWLIKKKVDEHMERQARKTPYEIAYEALIKLRNENLPKQEKIKEYYTGLSDIVRYYLEGRFAFRAPEMTTEEFLEDIKKSQVMEPAHKDLLKNFLSHCDMVKFARYGPTPLEMVDSMSAVEKLLDQTRKREEQPAGEGE